MTVSVIRKNDYNKIISLWKKDSNIRLSEADSKENIQIFLKRNPGTNFKILKNGHIIGTILCGNDGRRGYFHHLYIDSLFRKCGYAKLLVEKCIKILKKKHITKIHIFVLPNNVLGQEFWSKMGFYKRTENDFYIFSKDI